MYFHVSLCPCRAWGLIGFVAVIILQALTNLSRLSRSVDSYRRAQVFEEIGAALRNKKVDISAFRCYDKRHVKKEATISLDLLSAGDARGIPFIMGKSCICLPKRTYGSGRGRLLIKLMSKSHITY
jgi:hypothetical protein